LVVLVACSRSDERKQPAGADPWAAPAPPSPGVGGDDPWAAKRAADLPVAEGSGSNAVDSWGSGRPNGTGSRAAQGSAAGGSTSLAVGGSSALAGSYQCLQLRSTLGADNLFHSNYVSSSLSVFEIGDDGAYRSRSYPTQGTGRTQLDGTTVSFEDGPYAHAVGQAGTLESGKTYIRFSQDLTALPKPSMQSSDHMCYRK